MREFHTQLDVFEKLCLTAVELSDPVTAFREIDRALDAAVRHKRPVYLELPRDMVGVVPHVSHTYRGVQFRPDPEVVAEAAEEVAELLSKAERPLILAGVEIHRFGLQDKLLALAEKCQIPIAATLLGKSVIRETHPLYIGLYEGALGRKEVTEYVEESDCVLVLGAFMTDINLGIYTANLDPAKCIYATSEQLRIRHHHYRGVLLGDLLTELIQREPKTVQRPIPETLGFQPTPFELQPSAPLTISRLMACINQQLEESTIVIADIGDALFAATELVSRKHTEFISPAYYTSMGFSVPAAIGAQSARPDARVLAIVGDGAFQMTGMELSTAVKMGYSPIVIVLDNRGYGTERILHPGDWKFNEIQPWKYARLPEIIGGGAGYEVRTEGEFHDALRAAWTDRERLHLIHAHLDVADCSRTLERLAERLGARVKGEPS